jgi:hypothetical protein
MSYEKGKFGVLIVAEMPKTPMFLRVIEPQK